MKNVHLILNIFRDSADIWSMCDVWICLGSSRRWSKIQVKVWRGGGTLTFLHDKKKLKKYTFWINIPACGADLRSIFRHFNFKWSIPRNLGFCLFWKKKFFLLLLTLIVQHNFRKPPDPARPDYCFETENANRNVVRREVTIYKNYLILKNQ